MLKNIHTTNSNAEERGWHLFLKSILQIAKTIRKKQAENKDRDYPSFKQKKIVWTINLLGKMGHVCRLMKNNTSQNCTT